MDGIGWQELLGILVIVAARFGVLVVAIFATIVLVRRWERR